MSTKINLKDAAGQYIKYLEEVGKKPSTVGTARRTMDIFVGHMSEDKEVGKILPVHVAGFFKSEVATMRNDKPRAEASILQIRRIVRGALVWWCEQGYAETVPLPKTEQRYLEPRRSRKASPEATEPTAETTDAQPEAAAESK